MTIYIEIESTETKKHAGTAKSTGRDYEIVKQRALFFREGERFPDKIDVLIDKGQSAYPVGKYTIHPDSYQIDRFGAVGLRLKLAPLVK